MVLTEQKKFYYNNVLYIIRTINRIYYLISCLEKSKQESYYQKLNFILKEFKEEQEIFSEIAKDLENNAPFKGYQGFAMKLFEEDLEKILNEVTKNITSLENNLLNIVFTKINNYTINLESSNFNIILFKELTDYIQSLIYNFNEETARILEIEIGYIFIETLRKIKINNVSKLIENTNPYFYNQIISFGENYIFDVILKDKNNPLYLELQEIKKEITKEVYLKLLYERAYSYNIMSHETIFIKVK